MKPIIFIVLLATSITMVCAQEPKVQTGEYTVTSSILELMGEADAQTFADKISIDKPIAWGVYVPEDYNPDAPAGVLVFINSRDTGEIEDEWKEVMAKNNLIWIGANESGNKISIAHRVAYAILAPRLISSKYNIDPQRVYISGFSGGGRMASMVATEYNDLFKGAIYNSGANFWGEGAQTRYEEMKNNRYVFITGTEDFNLEDTKQVYDAYKKAGVKNSKLIIVPDMAHKRPGQEALQTAINYLDARGLTPAMPPAK